MTGSGPTWQGDGEAKIACGAVLRQSPTQSVLRKGNCGSQMLHEPLASNTSCSCKCLQHVALQHHSLGEKKTLLKEFTLSHQGTELKSQKELVTP